MKMRKDESEKERERDKELSVSEKIEMLAPNIALIPESQPMRLLRISKSFSSTLPL
jgi:hypothetical protein